jgi:hypothetical protein
MDTDADQSFLRSAAHSRRADAHAALARGLYGAARHFSGDVAAELRRAAAAADELAALARTDRDTALNAYLGRFRPPPGWHARPARPDPRGDHPWW